MHSALDGLDLDALVAEMPTPLIVLDRHTQTIAYTNAAAQQLPFAYQEGDGWSAYDTDGELLLGDALPYRQAMLGATFSRRIVQFRRDNEARSLLFHCHMIDGIAVLTFNDVTSLDETQRKLREALQARDDLVSMAAHELRSPLGALQLVAERLARKAAEMVPDELRKIADTALRQTSRLTILVSNLLDVSRMRAGKFELELEETSLGDVVREACDTLVDQASAASTLVSVEVNDPVQGHWDRVRMEQVVVNLVTNAIKYGAGTPVQVQLDQRETFAILRVIDGGPGIPEPAQARIFEQFARASRTHTAQSLGLGLFIVRGIARAHGGDVSLESRPGQTVFTVELPIR